jgi:hypothetical protein
MDCEMDAPLTARLRKAPCEVTMTAGAFVRVAEARRMQTEREEAADRIEDLEMLALWCRSRLKNDRHRATFDRYADNPICRRHGEDEPPVVASAPVPTMATARAVDINDRLVRAHMVRDGLSDRPMPDLSDVSLRDAIEASIIAASLPPARTPDGRGTIHTCHVEPTRVVHLLAWALRPPLPHQTRETAHA